MISTDLLAQPAPSARASRPEDLLAQAILGIGLPEFFDDFLEFVKSYAFFDSGLVVCYHRRRRPDILYDALRHPLRSNSAPVYAAGAYLLDPMFLRAMRTSRDCIVRFLDIVTAEFPRSEYFLSYYQRSSVVDEMNVIVPCGPDAVLAVCIERSPFYERFSSQELEDLTRWLPTMSALLRRHWQSVEPEFVGPENDPEHDRLAGLLERFGASDLTPREHEVVQLILRGHSPAQMSERLGAAIETIRVHRRNIYRKLGVSSVGELFAIALRALGVSIATESSLAGRPDRLSPTSGRGRDGSER